MRASGRTLRTRGEDPRLTLAPAPLARAATSTLLVTGSADNMMKLWNVKTGECLYTWEFPTAVKRVAWSEDDQRILAVTEKRMGFPGGVSVFAINRDDLKNRASFFLSRAVDRPSSAR